ncbi:MAG: TRAP transporter small permease subunit [Pseudomonadota bacterium]
MQRLASSLALAAAFIGLACLLVLSCAILADALSRSFASAPIFGLSDLVELTAPVIVASCFPMAILHRQNIAIRFLGRALPARPGQSVEVFGQGVMLLILLGIAVEMARYTAGLIEFGQHTWLLRIPVWPSWALATALLASCIPIQLSVLREVVGAVRRGEGFRSTEDELLETEASGAEERS